MHCDIATCHGSHSCTNTHTRTTHQALEMLTALGSSDGHMRLTMGEEESEYKFAKLGKVKEVDMGHNSLTLIPNLKGCGALEALWLEHNKLTRIDDGAFEGASRLVSLALERNQITFVAAGAFSKLSVPSATMAMDLIDRLHPAGAARRVTSFMRSTSPGGMSDDKGGGALRGDAVRQELARVPTN